MIHYVCVATESKLYFPYLKQLLPELVVLGMGMKWKGYIMKYELLITYVETLKPDDIVCFIDAYDVLPTKNIDNLEKQFVKFSNSHPDVKMVVGGGEIPNKLQKICNDLVFENSKLNSGTYIGYVKNIKHILSYILQQSNIYDDQVELVKYANQKPNDIYIDTNNDFFCVVSKPLQQVSINGNETCSFIHANGNGCLEDFLLEHHKIVCDSNTKISNYMIHSNELTGKIHNYSKHEILKLTAKNPFYLKSSKMYILMNESNSAWYKSLEKSPITPPNWVFPIAWTVLYAVIIASGMVFLKNGGLLYSTGFIYYCVAWFLNLSWSHLFFKYERPDLSFAVILGLIVFIVLNIRGFYKVSHLASYLLVPYLAWVLFATYLNGYILFTNPKHRPEN